MYYHYYELDYPENEPADFLFEAESDEEALNFIPGAFCEYHLSETTEPIIKKDGKMIYLAYDDIRTIR